MEKTQTIKRVNMKIKHLLILTICLFCFNMLQSQNEWKLGLNFGSTLSNIRGNEVAELNNAALDFLIGTSIEYLFSENTSLKTNINYERKSFSRDINLGSISDPFDPVLSNNSVKARTTLSYLSIPVMVGYKFGSNKNFFINGGPFIGFFLDSGAKVDGEKVDENSNDLFNSSDYGFSLGIGTKIKLNETNNLNIELRNNLGLSNISAVAIIDDGNLKTNSLNLILNWEFDL